MLLNEIQMYSLLNKGMKTLQASKNEKKLIINMYWLGLAPEILD